MRYCSHVSSLMIVFLLSCLTQGQELRLVEQNVLKQIRSYSPLDIDWTDTDIESCNLGTQVLCKTLGTEQVVTEIRLGDLSLNTFQDLQDLTSLETLSFDRIDLSSFVDTISFSGLSNLKTLHFKEASITGLPDHFFQGLDNLIELDLSSNPWSSSLNKNTFSGLPELNVLRLGLSNLNEILSDNVFDLLSNLDYLDLTLSQLTSLPDNIFSNLSKLKTLAFQSNKFGSSLKRVLFQGLESLKKIHLINSQLRDVPEDIFDDMNQLENITISNNEIDTIFNNPWRLNNIYMNNNLLVRLPDMDPENMNTTFMYAKKHASFNMVIHKNRNFSNNCLSSCRDLTILDQIENFECIYSQNNPMIGLNCGHPCNGVYTLTSKCANTLYPTNFFEQIGEVYKLNIHTYIMDKHAIYVIKNVEIPNGSRIISYLKHKSGNIYIEGDSRAQIGENILFLLLLNTFEEVETFLNMIDNNEKYIIVYDTQTMDNYSNKINLNVQIPGGTTFGVESSQDFNTFYISNESENLLKLNRFIDLFECSEVSFSCTSRSNTLNLGEPITAYYDIVIEENVLIQADHLPNTNGYFVGHDARRVTLNNNILVLDVSNTFTTFCDTTNYDQQYIVFNNMIIEDDLSMIEIITPHGKINIEDTILESNQLKFKIPKSMKYYCDIHTCTTDACIIEDDGSIEDSELILNNNTIIIKDSNTTLQNSIIVITTPPGSSTPIVIDGGTMVINSSTLVYEIDNKDLFDSIQDGQSIVIIDTINGGSIEGQFDNIELIIPTDLEDCRNITATIE